jgi:RimJ/RimL family protein N-acetyltransferase
MALEILLGNRGNPDKDQHPGLRLPGTPKDKWVPVSSPEEASAVARAYIEAHGLGGGNWAGGEIRDADTHEPVGRISYNGRYWPVNDESEQAPTAPGMR